MIVFDTGALIALERRKQRAVKIWVAAKRDLIEVVAPGAVIAEWWRGRTDVRDAILAGIRVEPWIPGSARRPGTRLRRFLRRARSTRS